MAIEYLRGLCQRDEFAKGKFPVFGEPVRLADITLPVFARRLRDRPHRRLEGQL